MMNFFEKGLFNAFFKIRAAKIKNGSLIKSIILLPSFM